MSRQRCHNSRARQRRYLLPPVALAYKSPYASTNLSKLRYVEILDFVSISTYFLLGMWFKKIGYQRVGSREKDRKIYGKNICFSNKDNRNVRKRSTTLKKYGIKPEFNFCLLFL